VFRVVDSKGRVNSVKTEESELKTKLVQQCRERGWYARRIEDQFAVGILDVTVAISWRPVLFIEAKVTDGLKFSPTERQYIEGLQINKANSCAIAILVGWRDKVMYVDDWYREVFITKAFAQPKGLNYAETLEEWFTNGRQNDGHEHLIGGE
jgi:hypothetical protein